MKVLGSLTLSDGGSIKNFKAEMVTSEPAAPVTGQTWFNTAAKAYKYYDGTDIHTFATLAALTNFINQLASEDGAGLIGIKDVAGHFTAGTVEDALAEEAAARKGVVSDLASIAAGKGASLIGVEDAGDEIAATNVEAALVELAGKVTSNGTAVADLQAVAGAAKLSDITFTAPKVLTNGESLVTCLQKLDAAAGTAAGTAATMTLQDIYDHSVADETDPGNKFVSIKLATNKDLRFIDDSDDTVFLGIDSESGRVTISGDLHVSGTTTTVNSNETTFATQLIKPGAPGAVALTIKPDTGVTPAADLISAYNNGAEGSTPVFRIGADGKLYGAHGSFSGNLTVTGDINGVDPGALSTSFTEHTDTTGSKHAAANISFTAAGNSALTNTNVQAAVEEVEDMVDTLKSDLSSTATGKGASTIGVKSIDGVTGSNVQDVMEALHSEAAAAASAANTLATNLSGTTAGLGASMVGVAAIGGMTATTVQAALSQLLIAANASANFLYDGTTAAATHTVSHNLASKYVSCTVVVDDEVVLPESIHFNDANSLTVTFGMAVSCKVFVTK